MASRPIQILFGAIAALAVPGLASAAVEIGQRGQQVSSERPYLQCVPYARQVSGIRIFGDAHTWWGQAAGRYARGNEPRVGAVLAFPASGNMRLGHVAAVSRIVDSRTILLRHSNWSPINGRRGQIEDDVRAIDVSPQNDWSRVRVWFAPIQGLGTTAWPAHGFIYNRAPGATPAAESPMRIARIKPDIAKPARSAPRAIPADDPIGAIIARKTGRLAAR